jgi:hypothetical protein
MFLRTLLIFLLSTCSFIACESSGSSSGEGDSSSETDSTTGEETETDGTTGEETETDGTTGEETETDGTAGEETETDGTTGEETETDGTAGEETETDGTTGEETETDGTTGEETETDGTTGEETETDGTAGEETETDGTTGEETETDGTAGEETETDGTTGEETGGEVLCPEPDGLRPMRRSEHAGIYDPIGHRVIINGGSTGVPVNCGFPTPTFEADTWLYDIACNHWKQIASPVGRGRHMAIYDSTEHRMLTFGGRFRAGDSGPYILYNDLHALDLETETWEQLAVTTKAPAPRMNAVFVYDPAKHRALLFGGNTEGNIMAGYLPQNDTWELDLTTMAWTQLNVPNPPAPRLFAAALWDAKRERLVLTGGADESAFGNQAAYFNDLWALDFNGAEPTWIALEQGEFIPDGRFWGGMIHAVESDTYMLFGGHDDTNLGNRNDVQAHLPEESAWITIHAGDTWNKPANGFCSFPPDFTNVDMASPERRSAHVMVAGADKAWIVHGKTDCGVVDDLVEIDFETAEWTTLSPATVGVSCIRKGGVNCNDLCF